MDLNDISTEELEEEVEKRKRDAIPKPLSVIGLTALTRICNEYINGLAGGYQIKDGEHYIFETAIEAVYGKDVWDWVNSQDCML